MKNKNEILAEIKSKDDSISTVQWSLDNDIKDESKRLSYVRDLNFLKGYRNALFDSQKNSKKQLLEIIQVLNRSIENIENFLKTEKDPLKIVEYNENLNKLKGGKDAYWWIIDQKE